MNKKTQSEMNQPFPETLLTGEDVSRVLKVSRSLAYQLMRHGEIPTVRFGRNVRVRPEDLNRFITDNVVNGESRGWE